MNEVVSRLGRIASLHDIAVVLSCQTITRIREGSRALLVPAISGTEWDNGISTRLVLFRDWVPAQGKWNDSDSNRLQRARFAGVVKVNGVISADEGGVGNVVPFTIEGTGLQDLAVDAAVDIAAPVPPAQQKSPARPPKRRKTEIADSDEDEPDSDELYSYLEDDEEVAAEALLFEESEGIIPADESHSVAEDVATATIVTVPQEDSGATRRLG
jgi:hypothetical protein